MELLDRLEVPRRLRPALAHLADAVRRDGLDPDQEAATAARDRETEQLVVVCDPDRGQTAPALLERDQRPVQLLDVHGVLDRAQVEEEERVAVEAFDLADHLGHRPMEVAGPGDRHDAEGAAPRAAAHSLHRVERDVALALQQVAARLGHVLEAVVGRLVVTRPEPAGGEVAQQPWP